MVRHRRNRDSIWKSQLVNLLTLVTVLAIALLSLVWLIQQGDRQAAARSAHVQQQIARAAVLSREHRHKLALGITMRAGIDKGQRFVDGTVHSHGIDQDGGVGQLGRLDSVAFNNIIDNIEIGKVDPDHLTAVQERLLNAALARQARYSIDRIAEAKIKKREKARASKQARLHMLGDQQRLQGFLGSSVYATYQDERRRNMQGRGIVIAAGGPMQLASAYATLKTLREHLGCTLPVELFYNGSAEMDNKTLDLFQVGCAQTHA